MSRTTQLRYMAIALLAGAAALLTAASARAFSLGNSETARGGNAAFADPDGRVGKMFGLTQDDESSSSLSSPARPTGTSNPYRNYHVDSLTSPPDPLSRPR